MGNKRTPGRSLEEWMDLVIQCRQSGLTDAAWCNEHGKASTLDLTSHKQDVVQIAIEPEDSPAGLIPDTGISPLHPDNSHTIEIEAKGFLIRISNDVQPALLKILADVLRKSSC